MIPHTPDPVVALMEEQKGIENKGGTMRLGHYPCQIGTGTKTHQSYQVSEVLKGIVIDTNLIIVIATCLKKKWIDLKWSVA